MHFEVYPDADSATTGENAIATSQVAFPEKMLSKVYEEGAYEGSAENLTKVSLDTDNVFSDGYDLEMGTFSGSPSAGYKGSLAVAVDTTTEASMGGAPGGGTPPEGGDGGTPPEPPTE
ncbi:MAG TPA: 3,4-dioxygenase subunit beta, partial [Nocardioides sp.]